jgi:hypothetical protein
MELVLRTMGFGAHLLLHSPLSGHCARYGFGEPYTVRLWGAPMDEAATLRFLWWTIGGVVGAVFLLNAIALSLI